MGVAKELWVVDGVEAPWWAIAVGCANGEGNAWLGEVGYNFNMHDSTCIEVRFNTDYRRGAFHILKYRPGYTPPTLDTGVKHDTGKTLMGLIPPRAELAMAQVLTFGAQKYGPENWRKVENAQQRYLDALMRHLNSHRSGELLDAETGLSHLAHAMCCMSFLLELQLMGEAAQ